MGEDSTQVQTPVAKILLAILSEVLAYLRWLVMTPMILTYGIVTLLVLITFWSFLSQSLMLPLVAAKYFPQGIHLDANGVEALFFRGWFVFSIFLHFSHKIIEAVTHKKIVVGFFKKIGIQLLVLTGLYAILITSAYTHGGWFTKGGSDAASGFILFYVGTVVITIVSWLILGLFDMILSGIRAENT